jgi:hypothetical protein
MEAERRRHACLDVALDEGVEMIPLFAQVGRRRGQPAARLRFRRVRCPVVLEPGHEQRNVRRLGIERYVLPQGELIPGFHEPYLAEIIIREPQ